MCVHGVCHICALRSCVFFPSIFFTFKTKKAHLVFPCEVLVKQIQIPEPTLRHLAISAQLPFAPATDLENVRNRRQIWPKLPKQWHQPLVHTRSGRLHAAPGFNLCYKQCLHSQHKLLLELIEGAAQLSPPTPLVQNPATISFCCLLQHRVMHMQCGSSGDYTYK